MLNEIIENGGRTYKFIENKELCDLIESRLGVKVYPVDSPVFTTREDGTPLLSSELDQAIEGKEPILCRSVVCSSINLEEMVDKMAMHGVNIIEENLVLALQEAFGTTKPDKLYGLMLIITQPTMDSSDFIAKSKVILRGFWTTTCDLNKEKETLEVFYKEVCRRAEENMLKTGKLEGAHYAAMKQVLTEKGVKI